MIRKISVAFMTVMMIFVFPVSYAQNNDTVILSALSFSLDSKDYYDTSPDGFDNDWYDQKYFPIEVTSGFLEMRISEWVTYNVNVDTGGFYSVGMFAACKDNVDVAFKAGDSVCYVNFPKTDLQSLEFQKRYNLGNIYLKQGNNKFIVKNSGFTHINFKEFYFEYNPDGSEEAVGKKACEYINGVDSVNVNVNSNDILEYNIECIGGEYALVMNGSSKRDVSLFFDINGEKYNGIMHFLSTSPENKDEYIKNVHLNNGINNIKIKFNCENFDFDSFRLENVNSPRYKLFYGLNNSKSSCEVYDILLNYGKKVGINLENDTKDMFYPKMSFWQMASKKYNSKNEITEIYNNVILDENINPTVKLINNNNEQVNKIPSGNSKIVVDCKYIPKNVSVITALYKNNKLYKNVDMKESKQESIETLLENIKNNDNNISLEIMTFEKLSDIKPYSAGIYKNIYVSVNGNNNGDGSIENPFNTIVKAFDETKKYIDKMTGDIVINVGGGVYNLTESMYINEKLSGKNGYNVVLKAQDENNKPIISGGEKVTGWQQARGTPFWYANVNTDDTRSLYINDYPATLAKSKYLYRAADYIRPSSPIHESHTTDGLVIPKANFPKKLQNEKNLILVYNNSFANQRAKADRVTYDSKNANIYMKNPYYAASSYWFGNTNINTNFDKCFYLENAMELMDEPGEFYFNSIAKRIYYYPYENENMNLCESYCGNIENMVYLKGSDKNNKLKNFIVDGMVFKYGKFTDTNIRGAVFTQTDNRRIGSEDWYGDSMFSSQVTVNYSENIIIKNCDFSCLGSNALNLDEAVINAKVSGNNFCDISGTGVVVGSFLHNNNMPLASQRCENIEIFDNAFRRCAQEYMGLTAISAYYVKNVNIHHNDIKDMPYSAIVLGWGWGDNVSECKNNKISYNRIENAMQCMNDGACIYTLGAMNNTQICDNYLVNSKDSSGIYLDQATEHISVCDNVAENTNMWLFARAGAGIRDIYANNNFTDDRNEIYDKKNVILKNTTTVPDRNWYGEAENIVNESGLETKRDISYIDNYPTWRKMRMNDYPKEEFNKNNINNKWIKAADYSDYYVTVTSKPELYPFGCIGNTRKGNWFEYKLNVPENGTYHITIAAGALKEKNITPQVSLYIDGNISCGIKNATATIETYNIPYLTNLGDFSNHYLTQGEHTLRINLDNAALILSGIRIENTDITEESDSIYDEGKLK